MANTRNQIRVLMWIIVIYMLAALCWWSILLLKFNDQIFELEQIHADAVQKEIAYKEFNRNKNMIIGEGIFFGLALITGIYFLYRSYKKELEISKRQNNFLLSVTHELKTPLSVLSLTNQTLTSRDLPKEKQQEILHQAGTELERLEDLVNNILTATKIDHQHSTQIENFKVSQILEEILNKLKTRYPNPILLDVQNDFNIHVDKELFELALKNLIDNACKYSSSESEVRIITKKENKLATIAVKDQGIGVDVG